MGCWRAYEDGQVLRVLGEVGRRGVRRRGGRGGVRHDEYPQV